MGEEGEGEYDFLNCVLLNILNTLYTKKQAHYSFALEINKIFYNSFQIPPLPWEIGCYQSKTVWVLKITYTKPSDNKVNLKQGEIFQKLFYMVITKPKYL